MSLESLPPPIIALAAPMELARWSFWEAEAAVVSNTYIRAVAKAGGVSVLIPPNSMTVGVIDSILDAVDGVMLIGGSDLDPATYGAKRESFTEQGSPVRDQCELAIARRALERDIPLLGICRGMQVMNVVLGGTLVQHLKGPSLVHRRALGTFDGTEHVVHLSPGSRVRRVVGERNHIVHCHHHQAVDVLGKGLKVVGTAAYDGVVEAVESSQHSFAVGVQWHPEANETSGIIASLVDAARHERTAKRTPVEA